MKVHQEFDSWDAVKCAEYALNHLYNARDLLNKAKNWGWVDIFGGGLLVTVAKRNRIEEAQNEMTQARRYINRLLSMMNEGSKVSFTRIESGGFLQFTDFIIDNLISDIMVQNRIEEIRTEVDNTIVKVEAIKERLYQI